MTATRHTVRRDLAVLARHVRQQPWLDLALRDEFVNRLRHPTAASLAYDVDLLLWDRTTPPRVREAAARLEALIEVLTEPQLARLLGAA